MLHTFWSVKGGAGVTVCAAGFAAAAVRRGPVTIVDLCGDQPVVLGAPAAVASTGLYDWFARPVHPVGALDRLVHDVADELGLLTRGNARLLGFPDRVPDFVSWTRTRRGTVVVDAGVCFTEGSDPARDDLTTALAQAGRSWMVTRGCYQSIRRATTCDVDSDGLVVIDEPERPFNHRDIQNLLHRPVAARVRAEPTVTKTVDAGTLLRRQPRNLMSSLERLR